MASITTTAPILLGGFTIPWETLRTLLPDDRWTVYCAGWVTAPGPAVRASVCYQLDGGSLVEVGGANLPASGKAELGPYPVRGEFAIAKGVPAGERIISVALRAGLVSAGSAASMTRWTMWLRMTPRNA
jgi:hypothetical protein